jgi:hypothetical protein
MNAKLGLISLLGLVGGCASTGVAPGVGEADFSSFIHREAPSVVVGEARVVDARVNPLVPVQADADGNAVTLRFGKPGRAAAVASVDPASLEVVSVRAPREGEGAAPAGAKRVTLEGGRFIVCWKRGDTERGYRALAQTYKPDGTPVGAPIVISPPDVDVMGVPQAATTDGRHVVATFAVASDDKFELMAVGLEDATAPSADAPDARTAGR